MLLPRYESFKQEIILFEGLADMTPTQIILPDPPDLRKIAGGKLSTQDQKFIRTPLPHRFKALPKEDRNKFIEQEWKRRREGYWFMNNGVPTYITGPHYFYVNWNKIDIGYPKYRNTDAEIYYHWDKAEKDADCFGLIELTCRRQGKSFRAGSIALEYTSGHSNANAGFQSKTYTDVKKMFQKTVIQPWRKLPYFFQPQFDNSTFPKTELRFFAPSERGKEGRANIDMELAELESLMDCQPSTDVAYDGQKEHIYVGDEEGKTIEVDVYERWEVVKKCLENEGKVIGKALHTSTVEEMEKKGGKNFKRIWDESDPAEKSERNRTKSGLWKHFLPAYRGLYYDEYGNCDEARGRDELEKERRSIEHDSRKLASEKRKNPFTVREAFRTDAKDCNFNSEIIQNRMEEFHLGNPHKVEGIFRWKNNEQDTEVEWVPMPKGQGRFFVSKLLDARHANQWEIERGFKVPANRTRFVAGGDPFKLNNPKGTRRSKGSGAVFWMHDSSVDAPGKDMDEWESNRFICTYEHRPRTKELYGEDMIMMCMYYGSLMSPEINFDFLMDYFEKRGYRGYLYHKRDKNTGKKEKNAGDTTNMAVQEEIYREVETYIEMHGKREVHDEWLQQCLDIEDKMTDYDLFVACGYALLAAKGNISRIKPIQVESKKYLRKITYQ